jgi:hypothetical protein
MNAYQPIVVVVAILLSISSNVFAWTPPAVKEYRNQLAATAGGGSSVHGTNSPRSTTTYLPVDDNTGVTYTALTSTLGPITTLTALETNGTLVAPGASVSLSGTTAANFLVRSMTVTAAFKAEFPRDGLVLTISKNGGTPVTLMATSFTGTLTGTVSGHVATITYDVTSPYLLESFSDMRTFTAPTSHTVIPSSGLGAFASFTNASPQGTWEATLTHNPQVGTPLLWFQSFSITFVGDPATGSVGGRSFDTTKRIDQTTGTPRSQTER